MNINAKNYFLRYASIIFVVVVFTFFTKTSYALASDLCAVDFGVSGVNGTWTEDGSQYGHPRYINGSLHLFFWNNNFWYLTYGFNDGGYTTDNPAYYWSEQNVATPDLITSGIVYEPNGGVSPYGSFTVGACGGEPTPTPSSTVEIPPPVLAPYVLYDYASTTCNQIGTSSPVQYSCFSSSSAQYVKYSDWVFLNTIIIFLLAFIPVSALFSLVKRK